MDTMRHSGDDVGTGGPDEAASPGRQDDGGGVTEVFGEVVPSAPSGLTRTLRALLAGTTHLIALLERDGTVAHVSPSITGLLGHSPESVIGSNVLSYVHPEDHRMAAAMLDSGSTGRPGGLAWEDAEIPGEYRLRHADGRWLPFEVLRNDFRSDPAIGGILVIASSVVARRALDTALTALAYDDEGTHALCRLAEYAEVRVPGTASAFAIADGTASWFGGHAGGDLLANLDSRPVLAATGVDPVFSGLGDSTPHLDEETRGRARRQGFRAWWRFPIPVRRPRVYPMADRFNDDAPTLGCLIVFSRRYEEPLAVHLGVLERISGLADVVLRRRLTTRTLRHLIAHDEVTGVLSRKGFEGLAAEQELESGAVMVIDLDDFKLVNDRHGHPVGDQVLRITAQRIQSLLRPGDFLGRLGGDEFVLRVTRAEAQEATSIAQRILAALEPPLVIDGRAVRVRASVGIATFEDGAQDDELLARADAAMYDAKRAGKARWRVWRPSG